MCPAYLNWVTYFLLDTRHMGYSGSVGVYLLPGAAGTFALDRIGAGIDARDRFSRSVAGGRASRPKSSPSVLVTHIHLDHAGAAGTLAQRYGAQVFVHENGAGHLVDPSRLLGSAGRIYGEQMDELWGDMDPLPQHLLRPVRDGETVEVLGHRIGVFYTPGHASHHVSYLLEQNAHVYRRRCRDSAARCSHGAARTAATRTAT